MTTFKHILTSTILLGSLAAPAFSQGAIGWGNDGAGQVSNTPPGANFTSVNGGALHAVATRVDGTSVAWGADTSGSVSGVSETEHYIALDAGQYYTLLIHSTGVIKYVGKGITALDSTPPGNDYVDLAGGLGHAVARHSTGALTSWGYSTTGAITNTPTTSDFTAVAAGNGHSMALRTNGSIVCWGDDSFGQVSGAPAGIGFTHIGAGGDASFAIRADGSLLAWGDDTYGQVSGAPTGIGFVQVDSGLAHALALRSDGTLASWGDDYFGQVTSTPTGLLFTDIAAGRHYSLAVYDFDCNGNGIGDPTDLATGTSLDCNGNAIPDECDFMAPYADIDKDGNLDECVTPPLGADVYELSIAAGGAQTFALTSDHPLDMYILMGSLSGTTPGITSGAFTLPLNPDSYFAHTLSALNQPPLATSFGVIQPDLPGTTGAGSASFTLPAALSPSMIGATVHHAYVTINFLSGALTSASNAVPLHLLP